ncbi:hypothetical protein FOMPIDRAFT_1118052 [Fomitopsis schrenkii]|uniref:Uncharacterized protein n=1 Tax=Fomitopsis schrenkii TaxID=2126942 RepID=S8FWM3_FOMSC|nr:hypothetical protein FOMPIDRAFT_1118052 [Fomitopsis schrenkii]
MGRSAKYHKKPATSTSTATSARAHTPTSKPAASTPTPQEQKKRVGLKVKAGKRRKDAEGPILGGADYVELMFGGRKRAMAEAAKLPRDD